MSISMAMIFPLIMIMIMLTVRGALYWYDRQIALSAAREGCESARLYQPSTTLPPIVIKDFLRRVAPGLAAREPEVVVKGTNIMCTVKVEAAPLFPGTPGILITQTITEPIERFVPATP